MIILLLFVIIGLCVAIYVKLPEKPDTQEGYYASEYYKLKECRCNPQYDEFQTMYNKDFSKSHPDYL